VFQEGLDEIIHSLPDGWLAADIDVRVEDAETTGAHELRAADALQVLGMCAAYRSPDPNQHYRFRVGHHEGVGASATMAWMAMRMLDDNRLRGGVILVNVATDNPANLQRWQRPDHLRPFGPVRAAVVETADGGYTLGTAA
jgi:hypothetical protein